MIELYYWTTSNGHKILMYLEKTGLDHTTKPSVTEDGKSILFGKSALSTGAEK